MRRCLALRYRRAAQMAVARLQSAASARCMPEQGRLSMNIGGVSRLSWLPVDIEQLQREATTLRD